MRRGLKKLKHIVNPTLKLLFLTIIVVFYLLLGCEDSPLPIMVTQVESVTIEGTLLLNEELIARVNPSESEVNYQWVRSRYKFGDYEEIPGAKNQTYLVKEADQSYFIKVLVTGKGDSIGRVVSEPLNPTKEFDGGDSGDNPGDDQGGEAGDSPPILNIIEEVVITGNPVWNTELMAQVDPDGAEVDYQWYRSKDKLGDYQIIPEATDSTYKIKKNDEDYFLRVLITGKGDTLGRAFSQEIGPVIEPNYYKLFVYMQALDIASVDTEKAVIIDDYVKIENSDYDRIEALLGSEVHVEYEEIEGFVPNRDHPMTVESGVVNRLNRLVLRIFYDRELYTVTFDSNGGSQVDPLELKYEEEIGEKPTRIGYKFDGWYDAEDNEVEKAGGNGTLYARWTAKEYKVTLDPQGGSVDPLTEQVTYDISYGELPTPTKTGYAFKGWYLEEAYQNEITSNTIVKVADNHTLYAKGEINHVSLEQNYTINPSPQFSWEAVLVFWGVSFSKRSPAHSLLGHQNQRLHKYPTACQRKE